MIYAVFGGEYSGWYVLGYFTDKKKADDFCKECNKTKSKWDSPLYVKDLPNIEHEEVDKKIWVCVSSTTWSAEPSYFEDEHIVETYEGNFLIYMAIYPSEMTRVAKIAQDRLAKWKAENEGII